VEFDPDFGGSGCCSPPARHATMPTSERPQPGRAAAPAACQQRSGESAPSAKEIVDGERTLRKKKKVHKGLPG